MVDSASLEGDLAAIDLAADPDGWALTAYRLAVARSELASNRHDLVGSVDLLEKAARILTAERAPLEHGRIQTALGNCRRAAGRSDLAAEAFDQAAELLTGRTGEAEQAAALVNVGLARAEIGDGAGSLAALDQAISLLADVDGEEAARMRGAALLNRAQAHQSLGSDSDLEAARDDYRSAVATLPPESPQSGMAHHGLGTALLEQARRSAGSSALVDQALGAFDQSLAVFTANSFPFQHAIVRHSLAVAHRHRSQTVDSEPEPALLDLARAAHHSELAGQMFDPRLHPGQWRAANRTVTEIEAALAPRSRTRAVVDLLAATDDDERRAILRDRLVPMVDWPEVRVTADLAGLAAALTELSVDSYRLVAESVIAVLMELPDRILETACRSLVAANAASAHPDGYNKALDDAIQARLFGPQRVRVRDLLEAAGWERP